MLVKLKQLAKNSTLGLLQLTGVLPFYLRRKLANRAVVLTYHRVLPASKQKESFSADGIIVTPETFRLHMKVLASRLRPLSADEFSQVLNGKQPMPKGACLVTFDDGWWDNLEYALPILQEYKVPAIVFVATDYIGSSRCFWQESLSRMLFSIWLQGESGLAILRDLNLTFKGEVNAAQARVRIRSFVTDVKRKSMTEIDALIAQVAALMRGAAFTQPDALQVDRFMSWADVTELHLSGIVSIGSHCCSHTPLTKLDHKAVARELAMSGEILDSRLGSRPTTMAYPNGDCDEDIANLVREAGYRAAFTTERGHVTQGGDIRRLCRMNMHESSTNTEAAFLARLTGLI